MMALPITAIYCETGLVVMHALHLSPLFLSCSGLWDGCQLMPVQCGPLLPTENFHNCVWLFSIFSGLGDVLSVPCNPQCGGHRGKSHIFGFIFLHCIHGKASGPWCGHHLIIKAGLEHFQFWCARYHFCLPKDSDDLIYCIGAFCNIQIHCFIKWASTFCARSSTSQFDLWTCSLLYGTLEDWIRISIFGIYWNLFFEQLTDESQNGYVQQDGATAHTANKWMRQLQEVFDDRPIATELRPPKWPDLSVCDFHSGATLKGKSTETTLALLMVSRKRSGM